MQGAACGAGTVGVYHQNVRSLLPKMDKIRYISRATDAAVVCLTETHLSDNIDNRAVCVPGYAITGRDWPSGAGGGLAVAGRDDLGAETRTMTRHSGSKLESLWL